MAVGTHYLLLDHLLVFILHFFMDTNQFKESCEVIQVKISSTDTKYINNMNQYKNMLGYLSNNI